MCEANGRFAQKIALSAKSDGVNKRLVRQLLKKWEADYVLAVVLYGVAVALVVFRLERYVAQRIQPVGQVNVPPKNVLPVRLVLV